jgi:Na+/proline symporter/signal transduction histidine kinase
MDINIDSAIFITFLLVNLAVGLFYGRGISSIKEYAIGNRNFSTATLSATIVATWISGSFFTISVSETYKEGLLFFFASLGEVAALSITAIFLAPRIKEFFDSLSVAEVMGKLYGKKIRVVTAICSIAQAIGMTSLQIKVFSTIFSHFLSLSNVAATLISSFVVITYSAIGGIRSVTFTDVIQFLTFGLCIPIFAIFVWQVFGDTDLVMEVFQTNPAFNYREVFNYSNAKFLPSLFLFIYFAIPGLNSTMFQRILMARDTKQVRQSYLVASFVCLFVRIISCFIGLVVLAHNPILPPDNVAIYVIDHYSFTGLKGLAIVGIMAMIMSTADSWINTGSVIFSHDFCKPLGIKFQNELLLSRAFAVFAGCFAVILALTAKDLLKLLLLQGKFYKPIVLPPLLFAILGFRSTSKAVAVGMIAGGISVVLWLNVITPATGIDGIIPSTFTNLIAFIGFHYLFKQTGGWIRSSSKLKKNVEKLSAKERLFSQFRFTSFEDLTTYCKAQTPKNESIYMYFAFATLFTAFITLTLDKTVYINNFTIINQLQALALFISTIFFCNKLWPVDFREKYIGIIWHVSVFIVLAFISSFLVLMSDFSQASLIIFILSLTMIGVLLNWQSALIMIVIGVASSYFLHKWCVVDIPHLSEGLHGLKLKMAYILLMVGGFMLAFLKPRQEYQELTEEKNEHLNGRLCQKDKEVQEALAIKAEFLRNIPHEYHAAMTGVISTSETLREAYDKLSDKQKRMAIDNIFTSSISLKSFDDNITTLARLSKPDYELNKEDVDFSVLVHDRIQMCRKYYEENTEDREFILNIKGDVIVNADKSYMIHLLDNLIINAIKYCKKGKISIILRKSKESVDFVIADEGIGIPKTELFDVFEPFTVSSKTRTPAGGRGNGLAVCKRIVEAHSGSISADSNGEVGATLKVVLPL